MTRFALCLLLMGCGRAVLEGPDGGGDGDARVTVALEVTVTGEGAVTSDPPGVDCGETCSARFPEGTEVTLTSVPDDSAGLREWSGDCSGFAKNCALTLDAARSVAAEFAPRGSSRWVEHITFSGRSFLTSDAVLSGDGNPIIASRVDDGGGSDLYVAKFDKLTGNVVWDNHLDTPSNEYYGGLAVDANGNVYAAMTILGSGDPFLIGDTEVSADLLGNIIAIRLAADTGEVDWVMEWGGDAQDRPSAVAVAGETLFVAGETSSNPATFGDKTITGSTGDAFLVKASIADGSVLNAKHFEGNIDINSVAVNGTQVAVAGNFAGVPTIDAPCSISSSGVGTDGFVAELLQSDLDCQWAKDFGDNTDEHDSSVHGLAAYPEGGWVATGSFKGNVLFADSGSALSSRGGFDAFAVRYAANGDHVWSFRYGDEGYDLGTTIAVTPAGNTIFAGVFESEITFGVHDLTGADDVFVTRMSAGVTPTSEWAVALGGNTIDRPEGLAVDVDGNAYVLAYFTGMTNVDGNPFTAAEYDAWLAALVH